jgi:Ca-activated chloride channel family protein
MTFLWPQFLWLLLALPLLVLLYVWLLRRRKALALRYASLSIVKEAMGKGPGIRRHIPPVLFLLALAAMLLAAARPFAVVTLPSQQETIILAMDVSGSMRATDVKPNRLVASQAAAKAFLEELPRNVRVGIVSFAGTAQVVQPPTLSREDLVAAIDKFQMQRATAIGSAIVIALAELFPDQGIDLDTVARASGRPRATPLDAAPKKPQKKFTPVEAGVLQLRRHHHAHRRPAHHRRGSHWRLPRWPPNAASASTPWASARWSGETIGFDGWSHARATGRRDAEKHLGSRRTGEYFYAGTAENLKAVYEKLGSRLTVEKKETEISALLALAAAVLSLLAGGLSLWWFNRVL